MGIGMHDPAIPSTTNAEDRSKCCEGCACRATNTFAPGPTGVRSLAEQGIVHYCHEWMRDGVLQGSLCAGWLAYRRVHVKQHGTALDWQPDTAWKAEAVQALGSWEA